MGIFAKLVILSSNTKHFIVVGFAENVFEFLCCDKVTCISISSICIPTTGHRCDFIFRSYFDSYQGIAVLVMRKAHAGHTRNVPPIAIATEVESIAI